MAAAFASQLLRVAHKLSLGFFWGISVLCQCQCSGRLNQGQLERSGRITVLNTVGDGGLMTDTWGWTRSRFWPGLGAVCIRGIV